MQNSGCTKFAACAQIKKKFEFGKCTLIGVRVTRSRYAAYPNRGTYTDQGTHPDRVSVPYWLRDLLFCRYFAYPKLQIVYCQSNKSHSSKQKMSGVVDINFFQSKKAAENLNLILTSRVQVYLCPWHCSHMELFSTNKVVCSYHEWRTFFILCL